MHCHGQVTCSFELSNSDAKSAALPSKLAFSIRLACSVGLLEMLLMSIVGPSFLCMLRQVNSFGSKHNLSQPAIAFIRPFTQKRRSQSFDCDGSPLASTDLSHTVPDNVLACAGGQTALAASKMSGLVAAGFHRPEPHRPSRSGLLAIWQPLPTSLLSPAAHSSHFMAPGGKTGSSKAEALGSASGVWQLCLVAELGVDSPPTAICWLDHLQAAAPALAVAQGPASLTVYAQLPR